MHRKQRFILLASSLLLTTAVMAVPPLGSRKPEFQGAYKLTFSGQWIGSGNGAVSAANVNINGQAEDTAGNKVKIQCSNLDLANGRFNGTGTIDGRDVKISGRVEEGFRDGSPRLIGTISDSANHVYGRVAGSRKGP